MSQSAVEPIAAPYLARGACRALELLGYVSLVEFPLANGRRAIFSRSARPAIS
jgi:hypothetical protein